MKRSGSIFQAHKAVLRLACALAFTVAAQAQSYEEIVIHRFNPYRTGAIPNAMIRDTAGNFYGTTPTGGPFNSGVVYKVDTAGQATVLHYFTGGSDGGAPHAPLIADPNGNLYGTASSGGLGSGVVYEIENTGQFKTLYTFTGGSDGSMPYGALTLDPEGNLYGTTSKGGQVPPLYQNGVVFELSPTGTETVLYTFTGGEDGGLPYSNLIRDNAGNLYGTNTWNGELGIDGGFLYKIDPTGKETSLHGFGYPPNAPLITDGKGAIYGTLNIIPAGGQDDGGILWKFDSTGYHVLYTFPPVSGFLGGLALDTDGNVYGTTGATQNSSGTLYELTAGGQFSTVYHFQGSLNGESPNSVIVSAQGNILGTTQIGGSGNVGAIFRITSAGAESLIYNFPQQDGCASSAGLIADAQGNLYGTTLRCGTAGQGTVFKIDNQGMETVLYSFQGGTDGANPAAELIRDQSGNLYGTTTWGGANGMGTVFRLSSTGQETILHSFGSPGDGVNPNAGLTVDSAGDLYGTTIYGGASNAGTVFELSSSGGESVLYSFAGGNDGGFPNSVLIRDSAGNLFGTAAEGAVQSGVIFKVDPAGVETVLYSFQGAIANDGAFPNSTLTVDSAGDLYGTTSQGGAHNGGTVFKLNSHGRESVLYSFDPTSPYGSGPEAGVIRDSAGNLYGTASGLASSGFAAGTHGVVYKLSAAGAYTVLYSFSGSMDDAFPVGNLLAGPGGALYGTTRGQFVSTQVDPQGYIVLDEFGGQVFALKPIP